MPLVLIVVILLVQKKSIPPIIAVGWWSRYAERETDDGRETSIHWRWCNALSMAFLRREKVPRLGVHFLTQPTVNFKLSLLSEKFTVLNFALVFFLLLYNYIFLLSILKIKRHTVIRNQMYNIVIKCIRSTTSWMCVWPSLAKMLRAPQLSVRVGRR